MLVNTVAENKISYTNRDYKNAVAARKLQNTIGRPSLQALLRIIDGNMIPNCPVTRKDVMAAEEIFGPNLGSLEGKTVRRGEKHVAFKPVHLPLSISAKYRNIILCIDPMFVIKIPFLITISRHVKFGTVEVMKPQVGDDPCRPQAREATLRKTRV